MDNLHMIHDDTEPPQPADESSLQILVANEQSVLTVRTEQLQATVRRILVDARYRTAMISIAIVDDPTIHDLNRRHLQHDWPTDVLSFPLENKNDHLEGEVIVSVDTAKRNADEVCWPVTDELLLYTIHGTLHLVGYHDTLATDIKTMRLAEMYYLRQAGSILPGSDARWHGIESDIASLSNPEPRTPTLQS